jgi:isopenicillin N synthase-like dioxygenase
MQETDSLTFKNTDTKNIHTLTKSDLNSVKSHSSNSKVIKIDYSKLIDPNSNLNDEIEQAFGRQGLGLIIIKNIPNFSETREKILRKGFELAQLNEEDLKKLEKPEAKYMVGWSKGKAYTENDFEYLTGAFYGRTQTDRPKYNDSEFEEIYKNVWPEEEKIKDFKNSYIEMGTLMLNVQINMLRHLDNYLKEVIPQYRKGLMHDSFSKDYDCISRLLNYYPASTLDKDLIKSKGEKIKKNLCGWHRDFGILTGLTHPKYFNKNTGKEISGIKSGILVRDRNNEIHDVKFEENEMALQTGDASFILSGGNIIAAPHAVKDIEGMPEDAFRTTFINFFDPPFDYKLYLPENTTEKEIYEKDPFNLANMLTKFKQGCTYKEFIISAMENYHPTSEHDQQDKSTK